MHTERWSTAGKHTAESTLFSTPPQVTNSIMYLCLLVVICVLNEKLVEMSTC